MKKDDTWNYENENAIEGLCDIAPKDKEDSEEVLTDGTYTRCLFCLGTARRLTKGKSGFRCESCRRMFTDEDVLRARAIEEKEDQEEDSETD